MVVEKIDKERSGGRKLKPIALVVLVSTLLSFQPLKPSEAATPTIPWSFEITGTPVYGDGNNNYLVATAEVESLSYFIADARVTWYRDGIEVDVDTGRPSDRNRVVFNAIYTLSSEDIGHDIRALAEVTVRTIRFPGSDYFLDASKTVSILGKQALTPTTIIAGNPLVGSTLTVESAGWDANVTLTYSWFIDGQKFSTSFFTKPEIVIGDWMAGTTIAVEVTGSKPGFLSQISRFEVPELIAGGTLKMEPPSIQGEATRGSRLFAILGTIYDSNVSTTYRWLRDGTTIANSDTYLLTSEDVGYRVSLEVTASKPGFNDLKITVANPVTFDLFPTSPIPQIEGLLGVGQSISVNEGDWGADASLTYQWLRNGAPIVGENSKTYVLTANDLGSYISLDRTASQAFFQTLKQTSLSVGPIKASLTLTPAPNVSGVSKVGSSLSVVPGVWDQGASLSYQWLRDGGAIANATSSSYLLSPADAGRQISVQVTGSMAGYVSSTQTSLAISVSIGSLSLTPVPNVSGVSKVGSSLSVVPGVWDQGASLSYQWLRDGGAIANATSSSYLLSPADAGRQISVQVTGSMAGYVSSTQTSSDNYIPLKVIKIGSNSLLGVYKVGKVLTSTAKAWVDGAQISYQWRIDGKPIKAAVKRSITLLQSYKGRRISLSVTQKASGYKAVTSTSVAKRVG